jgi:Mor family transcriptional regulator
LKVIKYIPHKEINKEAWNHCLDNAVNQLVYAYSWYLDTVSPNWDALVLGNYEAIMPLTQRKRFTLSYLAQPAFTQQLGVFYSDLEHMHATNDFLTAIPDKFKLIELNLNTYNIQSNPSYTSKQNVTCHLDLSYSYEILKGNYSQQIIRNIKKAEASNLNICHEISPQTIVDLFKSNKGKTIKKLKNKIYNTLIDLCKVLTNNNALICLGIKNNAGVYIAGAIFIQYNDQVIFLFSGVNDEAKSCGAMSLLIDHFIKTNAASNLLLDFEGSNNQNLARFYLGFGAKSVNYYSIGKNNLPKIIRWVKG